MTEKMILVDKDRFDFLVYALFGCSNNPFPTVSKRAYRDLCRTLSLKGKNGETCRIQVDALLERSINELLKSNIATQYQFDQWHYATSIRMIDIYKAEDIVFTFGHAQKWINMAFKYLFIFGSLDLSRVFAFLHVPIDSYIFAAAENQLNIKRPCEAWSRMNDYNVYLNYQNEVREKLQKQAQPVEPLRWEFNSWLVEVNKNAIGF